MINKTEKIFDTDSYIDSFDGTVLEISRTEYNKDKAIAVILDRTCFFPEEGGQDSDRGFIILNDGTSNGIKLEVVHAAIHDDVITHYCKADESIIERADSFNGFKCSGKIDWPARYDKMQQHSGEHLVSGIVNSMFGYNNVGFHLGSEEVTMDYDGVFTDDELVKLEKKVNEAVWSDVKCIVTYPTKEELKSIDYRSKKEIDGQVRIVEFEGYDICACCAPHIRTTGEIGMVKIISSEHFKGGTRMTIKCGMRALDCFNDYIYSSREISRLLSVKIENVADGAKKIYDDLQKKNYELIDIQNKYVNLLVEKELENTASKVHVIFIDGFDTNVMRGAVNSMSEKLSGLCACFNGNDEKGYSFIFGSLDMDCNVAMSLFRTKYGAKGGGKPGMVQGSIALDKTTIISELQAIE